MQNAYGNEGLNRLNDIRWYSRFRGGRELVVNDNRGGRPKSTRTEVNIVAVYMPMELILNPKKCMFLPYVFSIFKKINA